MITFACPFCKKPLTVKDEFAGKTGKCPHCKKQSQVPAESAKVVDNKGADLEHEDTLAPIINDKVDTDSGVTNIEGTGKAEYIDFLAPAQAPDELGRLGPYRILKVLGAGGMGVVYQAEDPLLKRKVALKAMLPSLAVSESARQRFIREAQAAASIEHDHIVHIYQVGEDRGIPFIAMQFLKGEALDDRLKRQKRLPPSEAIRIGRETALGLAAAHKIGLVHRDIKPANLWLEEESNRVKILDFGLARAAAGGNANLTQAGAIVGTPAYMAPEQANGSSVDGRCDLFSLGCVLYRVTTGELPFKGSDTLSTLMAVASHNPKPPADLDEAIPKQLSSLIMKLLAKKPDKRPASAAEVAESLGKLQNSELTELDTPAPSPMRQGAADGKTTRPGPAQDATVDEHRKKGGMPLWLAVTGIGLAAILVIAIVALVVLQGNILGAKSSSGSEDQLSSGSSSSVDDSSVGSESSGTAKLGLGVWINSAAPDFPVADFDYQGMYATLGKASASSPKFGCEVIALGNGHFQAVVFPGGLPGHGWDGENKILLDGVRDASQVNFTPPKGKRTYGAGSAQAFSATEKFPPTGQKEWTATLKGEVLRVTTEEGVHVLLRNEPRVPSMGTKPPASAIILFDGTNTDHWDGGHIDKETKVLNPDGKDIRTKQKFNNFKLHLEFMVPFAPEKRGMARGNSGVFLVDTYEVQILDSFGMDGRNDEAGAIFKEVAPKLNVCHAPLSWQAFDIDFTNAIRQGDKKTNAFVHVNYNNVVVIQNEIPGPTQTGRTTEGAPGAIMLQGRYSPVQFRNIWLVDKDKK